MRFAVVMAGAAGFSVVLAVNLLLEKALDRSLIQAAVAATGFALLGRWWLKLWTTGLEQTQIERAQAEAEKAAQAAQEAGSTGAPGMAAVLKPTAIK